MSNYESHDLLRSNQQEKENEATSVRAGTKKSHQKTKSKAKKNKKGFSRTLNNTYIGHNEIQIFYYDQ